MDAKQTAILNGLQRDGLLHSWAIVYDSYDEWQSPDLVLEPAGQARPTTRELSGTGGPSCYDEWRATLDEDDENAPEVGLPADDYAEWLGVR